MHMLGTYQEAAQNILLWGWSASSALVTRQALSRLLVKRMQTLCQHVYMLVDQLPSLEVLIQYSIRRVLLRDLFTFEFLEKPRVEEALPENVGIHGIGNVLVVGFLGRGESSLHSTERQH